MSKISPTEFQRFRRKLGLKIQKLEMQISEAEDLAHQFPMPSNVRPAIASDIQEGAIIWYKRSPEHGGDCWNEVEDVLNPDDDFKAYVSGGARYGLFNAFIEINIKKP